MPAPWRDLRPIHTGGAKWSALKSADIPDGKPGVDRDVGPFAISGGLPVSLPLLFGSNLDCWFFLGKAVVNDHEMIIVQVAKVKVFGCRFLWTNAMLL